MKFTEEDFGFTFTDVGEATGVDWTALAAYINKVAAEIANKKVKDFKCETCNNREE